MRYQKCYHATYDGRRRSETVGDGRSFTWCKSISKASAPRFVSTKTTQRPWFGKWSLMTWTNDQTTTQLWHFHNDHLRSFTIVYGLRPAFFLRPMTQLLQWQLSVFSWKLIQVQMSSAKAVLHLDRLNRSTHGIRESENQRIRWNRDGIVMESCDRYSANRITNRQTDFYRNRFVIFVGAMTNRAPAETTDLVEGTDFLWSVICIDHLAVDPNRQTCCQHICIK